MQSSGAKINQQGRLQKRFVSKNALQCSPNRQLKYTCSWRMRLYHALESDCRCSGKHERFERLMPAAALAADPAQEWNTDVLAEEGVCILCSV